MPVMPFESTRRARCATTQSGCTSTYEDEAQDRGVLLITFTFCAAPIARILAGFWRDPHNLSQNECPHVPNLHRTVPRQRVVGCFGRSEPAEIASPKHFPRARTVGSGGHSQSRSRLGGPIR